MLHILCLHTTAQGSSNPLGIASTADNIRLLPYYLVKDMLGMLIMVMLLIMLVCFSSELLGHSDNAIEGNALVTPLHIVPEWYFLPYYAILRSIPHKLLGVCFMLLAILVIGMLPGLHSHKIRSTRFLPCLRIGMLSLLCCMLMLGWIGAMPVEEPYVTIGQLASIYYFSYFLIMLPMIDSLEAHMLASISSK